MTEEDIRKEVDTDVVKRCKSDRCGRPAEEGVDYCQNHAPYFSGGNRVEKPTEKVGNVRI